MKKLSLIAIALLPGIGAALPAGAAPRPKPAKSATSKATKPKAAPAKAGAEIPQQFSARCVGVMDGDTILVQLVRGGAKRDIKVELYGIDAPEPEQAFATEAQQSLVRQLLGKTVQLYSKGMDGEGRLSAWAFVGSRCANARQVEDGLAWWDRAQAPDEKKLGDLRNAALEARRGLWSEVAPTAPWDWRLGIQPDPPQISAQPMIPTNQLGRDQPDELPEAPPAQPLPTLPPLAQPPAILPDLPDMVITRVEFQPAEPKAGELIQPILHYKNIGSAPANAVLMFYEKNEIDGGGGNHTGPVAPGEQLSWLMGGMRAPKAGKFKLEFSLDPDDKIKEQNEKNNTLSVVLQVQK